MSDVMLSCFTCGLASLYIQRGGFLGCFCAYVLVPSAIPQLALITLLPVFTITNFPRLPVLYLWWIYTIAGSITATKIYAHACDNLGWLISLLRWLLFATETTLYFEAPFPPSPVTPSGAEYRCSATSNDIFVIFFVPIFFTTLWFSFWIDHKIWFFEVGVPFCGFATQRGPWPPHSWGF